MRANRTTPAIFLDRDGTIIEDQGYLRSPSEVVFFPETVQALRSLQRTFKLFVVTNQPGVAEGAVRPLEVAAVHEFIVSYLANAGIRIERVYCCPHRRSDKCRCIKPRPHYLRRAARDFGIDLAKSFVVGDHPHDMELARNAGARGLYVLTGHGAKHRCDLPQDAPVAADIGQAAAMILDMPDAKGPSPSSGTDIEKAAAIIRKGGVVAFPTETVYGLGANAFDANAVARIFEVKRRPRLDPLIAHVCNLEQVHLLAADFPPIAQDLANRFWSGPLTLVLPKRNNVPDIVTAGLPSVAMRMPDHSLALALIQEAATPLAAPSANLFGGVSPTTAEHVRKELGHDIDCVLDGGPCRVGIESTIVSLTEGHPRLLRLGGVAVEDLEAVVGSFLQLDSGSGHPTAPGQLAHHYAPRTPLMFGTDAGAMPSVRRVGLLSFQGTPPGRDFAATEVLSPEGNLYEAAASLRSWGRRSFFEQTRLMAMG